MVSTHRKIFMGYGHIIISIVGLSASFLLGLSTLRRWQKKQVTREKLRMIGEALEHAEERVARFQERHDHILREVSSCYLCHEELLNALVGAKAAMDDAIQFAARLRKMQMKLLINFPEEGDLLMLDLLLAIPNRSSGIND